MKISDLTLKAEAREHLGKGKAMKIRNGAKLPAVVYGPGIKDNIYISMDYKEFEKVFKANGKHMPFVLDTGKGKFNVIVKDYIVHPISRYFQHVDFFVYDAKKPFTTEIPVNYTGTPVGVKEGGGMYIFARSLRVNGQIADLPSSIEVDVTNLKISQYLIVRDIKKENYKILTHEGTALVEIK
jgi:large subunit ribosomal protein L25